MRALPRAALLGAAAALLAALALPGAAGATGFSQLYHDYASDGQIQTCTYASGDLRNAAGSIPPDVRAYDPGFGDALNGALGAPCGGGGTSIAAPPSSPASGPSTTTVDPQVADRQRAKHVARDGSPRPVVPVRPALPASALVLGPDQEVPLALLALAIALGLLVVTGSGLAIGHYFGLGLGRGSASPPRTGNRRWWGDGLAGLRDRVALL